MDTVAPASAGTEGLGGCRAVWFDAVEAMVPVARRHVVKACRRAGRPDLAEDAALVASELVTNAIRHGSYCPGDSVGVMVRRCIADDGIVICVRDSSPDLPVLRTVGPESIDWGDVEETSGNGLHLVARVSAGWGSRRLPNGKEVYAILH